MTTYIGLWHGGENYSLGQWATDAEWFTSLAHAKDVLLARARNSSHFAPRTHAVEWTAPLGDYLRPIKGHQLDQLHTPAADGSSLLLVETDLASLEHLEREGVHACSLQLVIGPRGGIRQERL